jgi:head-tail adaptor
MRTYDRVISLERYGTVEDQYGDQVAGWTPLKENVPARRRLAPGTERLASAELSATAPSIFYIPWAPEYSDLTPADRVTHEGRSYNLTSVQELGRHREIEIAGTAESD